jgi:hypothetical protein
MTEINLSNGADAARAMLTQLLQDRGIKTLAVVRGDVASRQLAQDVDLRTQGVPWRRAVWVQATGIMSATDEQDWFGADPDARAVVLSSVDDNRRVVGSLRSGASLSAIDKIMREADKR